MTKSRTAANPLCPTQSEALAESALVLELAAAQLVEIRQQLQEAGELVCKEFQEINEEIGNGNTRLREGLQRIVMALQFEDRFSQRLSEIGLALSLAGRAAANSLRQSETMRTKPSAPSCANWQMSCACTGALKHLQAATEMATSPASADVELF